MPVKARLLRSARIVSAGSGSVCFSTGTRFAGQRRFVDVQIALVQQAQIGRHAVAGLQQHHVAGHELRRGNPQLLTAAPHRGLGDDHLRQRVDGLLRFRLLEVADDGVDEDDAENDRRIHPLAQSSP